MPVDLLQNLNAGVDVRDCHRGCGGVVTFRNGVKYYSMSVGPDEDGEIEVRIENGVYRGYTRDGRVCRIAVVGGRKHWLRDETEQDESPVDIVEFIRCDWDDERAKGLPSETTP